MCQLQYKKVARRLLIFCVLRVNRIESLESVRTVDLSAAMVGACVGPDSQRTPPYYEYRTAGMSTRGFAESPTPKKKGKEQHY